MLKCDRWRINRTRNYSTAYFCMQNNEKRLYSIILEKSTILLFEEKMRYLQYMEILQICIYCPLLMFFYSHLGWKRTIESSFLCQVILNQTDPPFTVRELTTVKYKLSDIANDFRFVEKFNATKSVSRERMRRSRTRIWFQETNSYNFYILVVWIRRC